MHRIAVLFTTFLRDELAVNTLKTWLNNWDEKYHLFIGDQNGDHTGPGTKAKEVLYHEIESSGRGTIVPLPYDCGLSCARNMLVTRAFRGNYDWCLLAADSIALVDRLELQTAKAFLQGKEKRSIVGFGLEGRTNWEYDMDLKPGECFYLSVPRRPELHKANFLGYPVCGVEPLPDPATLSFQPVDICKNFFLAKTSTIRHVTWDEKLKLAEHEDYFWRLKQAGYEVFYCPQIKGQYIDDKPPEYNEKRERMYREFRTLLREKYGLRGWVKYEQILK